MFSKLFRRRPSHTTIVAYMALFAALGGTSYAAVKLPKNSVGSKQIKKNAVSASKVKNGSLLKADFKAGQLPAGPKGPQGPSGAAGSPGADGTADAFARVGAEAGRPLQPNQFKGMVQSGVVPGEAAAATGTTCFDLPFQPASAMVSLDNADAAAANRNLIASVAIDRGEDLGDCPAAFNDARVRIVDGNTETATDARFFIWFEK
jgi:hypothetical protein